MSFACAPPPGKRAEAAPHEWMHIPPELAGCFVEQEYQESTVQRPAALEGMRRCVPLCSACAIVQCVCLRYMDVVRVSPRSRVLGVAAGSATPHEHRIYRRALHGTAQHGGSTRRAVPPSSRSPALCALLWCVVRAGVCLQVGPGRDPRSSRVQCVAWPCSTLRTVDRASFEATVPLVWRGVHGVPPLLKHST